MNDAQKQRDSYTQLIKEVFGNAKGEELMALWQDIFGDRLSYIEGVSTEEVYSREGERRFYIALKSILNS